MQIVTRMMILIMNQEMYDVNKTELGINDVLQLIELTLGEGELLK